MVGTEESNEPVDHLMGGGDVIRWSSRQEGDTCKRFKTRSKKRQIGLLAIIILCQDL